MEKTEKEIISVLLEINFSMHNSKAVISLTGKTVWLHCFPARAAFRAREPGQSCDPTQRLVKRQKELEIFMNNTVRLSSVQRGHPFQYRSTLFSYLHELGFCRTKKREKIQQLEVACQKTLTHSLPSLSNGLKIENDHGKLQLHPLFSTGRDEEVRCPQKSPLFLCSDVLPVVVFTPKGVCGKFPWVLTSGSKRFNSASRMAYNISC